jgi:hypothetical protein
MNAAITAHLTFAPPRKFAPLPGYRQSGLSMVLVGLLLEPPIAATKGWDGFATMSLGHTQPPEGLLRELHEVAHDACALRASLTTEINFPLPPDFPKDQLLDISRSLAQLPIGTAEGCRAPLEYARNRLPAIRREYVLSEELDEPTNNTDATPVVLRNSLIDERLRRLIASVSTAIDEYRRLAVEELLKLEREIVVLRDEAEPAITQSLRLERELTSASEAVGGASAAADIGHFGRHHSHELDVGFERQVGHVDDAARHVLDSEARLGLDPAGRLQPAARGVLVAVGLAAGLQTAGGAPSLPSSVTAGSISCKARQIPSCPLRSHLIRRRCSSVDERPLPIVP